MKMTNTQALVELKLLDKKISDASARTIVGHVTNKSNKVTPQGYKNEEEFLKDIQARLDTALGLIEYRDKLKAKLAESNAKTLVKIGSEEMTVASAISRKNTLKSKLDLYNRIKQGLLQAQSQVDTHNSRLPALADDHVTKAFANIQTELDVRNNAREAFIRKNENTLLTTDKVKATIDKLEREIDEFNSSVDIALSVSNATNFIEI